MRVARLLGLTLAAFALPAAKPLAEEPIQYEDSRAYVPVTYADHPAEWFILDTGSTPTSLDNGTAAAWGLIPEAAGTVTGAGTGATKIGRLGNITLTTAGHDFPFEEINTAPLGELLPKFTGRRAPGIFGSRLFLDYVVELDFPHNMLRLYDKASFAYQGSGAVIPIEIEDGAPFATVSLMMPDGEAVDGKYLVDTGAKATMLLTEGFVAEHKLLDRFPAHVDSPLGSGIGGPTFYRFVRAHSAMIAGNPATALTGPILGLSINGSVKIDGVAGLLGADYLRRFRAIFDYGRRQMILEPAFEDNAPSDFDMSGLYFTASGADLRTYTVTVVQPNSPAAEAGVQVGDVLTRAELLPPGQMTLDELRHLLIREPAKTVHLEFDRAGRPVKAEIVLRRLI